jgi:MOSC domain-containing protein YiiM
MSLDRRSFASSLAQLLDVPSEAVPVPAGGDALVGFGEWLATRNLGLVFVRDPDSFTWPGHFLGIDEDGTTRVWYGSPPGRLDGAGTSPRFGEAAVLVPLDPGLPSGVPAASSQATGTVEAIVIAEAAEAACRRVERAKAQTGRGLEGDRYASGAGTFSRPGTSGRNLTLIAAEAIEALAAEHQIDLAPEDARRNIVTRGIQLDDLIGREFMIGQVRCRGARRAEPCAHLARLTQAGVLRGLVHRGGLRADILSGGEVSVGDAVRAT